MTSTLKQTQIEDDDFELPTKCDAIDTYHDSIPEVCDTVKRLVNLEVILNQPWLQQSSIDIYENNKSDLLIELTTDDMNMALFFTDSTNNITLFQNIFTK